MEKKRESREEVRISEVLRAMERPAYPEYIQKVVEQIQGWMSAALEGEEFPGEDEIFSSMERRFGMEPEYFFAQMEWLQAHADVIPSMQPSEDREDAVVIAIAPMDIEEGLRMAIDHAAVFSSGKCRRIWILSDNWVLGESFRYQPHVQTLKKRGILFHYILVTPWGWTEIPFTKNFGNRNIPWLGNEESENSGSGYPSGPPTGRRGREDKKS